MGIYLGVGNNPAKAGLIPHTTCTVMVQVKGRNWPPFEEPMSYQLVGGVTAYQGDDG
jgi:hypothetical protein